AGIQPSAPVTVAVTVNPSVDRITIDHVRYVKSLSRLIVTASDFSPAVTLTVTLAGPNGETPVINPATGSAYTGVMGPVIPFSPGGFSITFTNLPAPNLVTIRSSAGASITSGVTITPCYGAGERQKPALKSFGTTSSTAREHELLAERRELEKKFSLQIVPYLFFMASRVHGPAPFLQIHTLR